METTEYIDPLLGKIVGYKDENQNRPIYQLAKDIKVKIIDWTSIIENFKKNDDSLKNFKCDLREGNGIIFVGERKIPVLIDDECCGTQAEGKNIMSDGKVVSGDFFEKIGFYEKSNGFIRMHPTYLIDIDFKDIEKCFTGEEMELWEYMGSRYEYNPRIHQNLRGMVKLYKDIPDQKRQ